MTSNVHNPPIVIESGHVLKNAARIEDLRTNMEHRVEVPLTSWECSRILRRDFYIVTASMFKTCSRRGNEHRRSEVRRLLLELVLQGEVFDGESSAYEMTRDIPLDSTVPLRVVSGEANLLLRTFMNADKAMARLQCAVSDGLINREGRMRMFQDFIGPYMDLKKYVLGKPESNKTAAELGEELGVG